MANKQRRENPPRTVCPDCGKVHFGKCYVKMLKEGKAKVEQRLIHVAFCKKSMDNTHVQSEVTRGMLKAGIRGPDVVSWSVDACSVNILAHKNMQMANDIVIFLCLCISHCS